MDTQIKIVLRKHRYGGFQYDDKVVLNSILDEDFKLCDDIFSFKEYDKVEILYYSTNPGIVLRVESYVCEGNVEMKSGDKICLSPGGDDDAMLVPGHYDISIVDDKREFSGLYTIEPNSIDLNALMTMRETLDKICKGLSLNLYYERSGMEYVPNNMSGIDILAFSFLEGNLNEILSSISSISANPVEDVSNKYLLKANSERPDNKSQRWLNKHSDIMSRRNPYKEKSIILSYDNQENRLIKLICERLFYCVSKIENKISNHITFLKEKISDVEEKRSLLEVERDRLYSAYNVRRRANEIKRDIEILNMEKNEFKSKICRLEESFNNIKSCRNYIAIFLNEDWIKDIQVARKIKPTQKFLKRFDYSFLYSIYLEMLEKSSDSISSKSFPSKKTSLLYEVYSVVVVKDVLEELGFVWTDGWIKSASDILAFNGELSGGDELKFEKGEYVITVSYDKLLRRTSELKKSSKSGIVASNSDRRKPDILISLYKNGVFIKSMIIEVKYRKLSYLYNKNGETDVIHQLKEYRNLDYFDGSIGKISNIRPVEKVLVLYPSGIERIYTEEIYEFSFVTLLPLCESNPIGYNLIKNEVRNFVFNNK